MTTKQMTLELKDSQIILNFYTDLPFQSKLPKLIDTIHFKVHTISKLTMSLIHSK